MNSPTLLRITSHVCSVLIFFSLLKHSEVIFSSSSVVQHQPWHISYLSHSHVITDPHKNNQSHDNSNQNQRWAMASRNRGPHLPTIRHPHRDLRNSSQRVLHRAPLPRPSMHQTPRYQPHTPTTKSKPRIHDLLQSRPFIRRNQYQTHF